MCSVYHIMMNKCVFFFKMEYCCILNFLPQLMKIQESLNNFLLDSTKIMFNDVENTDSLITHIMAFTKNLMQADRCSMFLVDDDRWVNMYNCAIRRSIVPPKPYLKTANTETTPFHKKLSYNALFDLAVLSIEFHKIN